MVLERVSSDPISGHGHNDLIIVAINFIKENQNGCIPGSICKSRTFLHKIGGKFATLLIRNIQPAKQINTIFIDTRIILIGEEKHL